MTIFVERPISGAITVAAAVLLLAPVFKVFRRRSTQPAES
jgi:TctA family transporter